MRKIELVIFDFDGTLVDTAPDLIRSANLFLKSKGLKELPEERIRSEIGMGLRKLILDVFPGGQDQEQKLKDQIESEFLALYEQEYLTSPTLFPGAREFLTEFDGRMAIVSNKRERFIRPILEKLGVLDLPWVKIIGGDTFPNMKPHPEPFLAAIDSVGVLPEKTLIVGDGIADVEGTLALQSRCVAVEFGYTPVELLMELGAWKSIAHFDELQPLIQSIT